MPQVSPWSHGQAANGREVHRDGFLLQRLVAKPRLAMPPKAPAGGTKHLLVRNLLLVMTSNH